MQMSINLAETLKVEEMRIKETALQNRNGKERSEETRKSRLDYREEKTKKKRKIRGKLYYRKAQKRIRRIHCQERGVQEQQCFKNMEK
jgi:hypothetical protein